MRPVVDKHITINILGVRIGVYWMVPGQSAEMMTA